MGSATPHLGEVTNTRLACRNASKDSKTAFPTIKVPGELETLYLTTYNISHICNPQALPSPKQTSNMAGAQVVIAYPRAEDQRFDMDYYLTKHMTLAASHWKKHGLKSYDVTELNAESPYHICTTAYWGSLDDWNAAIKDESIGEIMADVEKFTNLKPIILYGKIVGKESF